jgi:hypothetical protein
MRGELVKHIEVSSVGNRCIIMYHCQVVVD